MILKDFVWWGHSNQCYSESGMDSERHCADLAQFRAYPVPIEYRHNSRGFRDSEWPDSVPELQSAVWCFGDSFTVGIGSAESRTWTQRLQHTLGRRCINVSQDGQSNQWILRKIQQLVQEIVPRTMVVHWSYTHRRFNPNFDLIRTREYYWQQFYQRIRDASWPEAVKFSDFETLPDAIQKEIKQIHHDPLRDKFNFESVSEAMYEQDQMLHYVHSATVEQDTQNTLNCIDQAQATADQHSINLVHSFVPAFAPQDQWPRVQQHLLNHGMKFVPLFDPLDRARDGHHYDLVTADYFVQQIIALI